MWFFYFTLRYHRNISLHRQTQYFVIGVIFNVVEDLVFITIDSEIFFVNTFIILN